MNDSLDDNDEEIADHMLEGGAESEESYSSRYSVMTGEYTDTSEALPPTGRRSKIWDEQVTKNLLDAYKAQQSYYYDLQFRWLRLVAAGKWSSDEAEALYREWKALQGGFEHV